MAGEIPEDSKEIIVNGVSFTHGEMFRVIDDFYTRIQNDELLKVPFQSVHDWPEHIQRLTHFWWIRFGGEPYMFTHYNPARKHFFAGFTNELLTRWLHIFGDTLKAHLREDQVQLWSFAAARMGQAVSFKNELMHREFEKSKNEQAGE
jgi:hemoglobin